MPNEQDKVIRKLRAILSADVKGYSLLMADDEALTIKTLKKYRGIMSGHIQQHTGRVVDAPGDNMLAEFASAVEAVQCAVDIQEALKIKNENLPEDKRLQFRIGVNIGDIVQDGDSIYGAGVNVAARIEGLADPGGICISRNAYDHIRDKLDLGYEYLGDHSVKNIKHPVRVYKVLMRSEDAGKLIGEKPKNRIKKWALPVAIITAIIMTSIVWHFFKSGTKPDIEPASIENMAFPLPESPSIAVLPLDNLSGNSEDESIADGISESIITALSKTPKMFVISRNSTFTYKGKATKIQQIAEDLGVRYVLEGSLQKLNDQLRINVQLIDAISGNHLWAEKYDRSMTDFFALQDDIAMKITTALNVQLTQGERANIIAKGTDNLEAYLKVLQGLQLAQSFNKERVTMAIKVAKEALSMDPNYPAAHYLLSRSIYKEVQVGAAKPSKLKFSIESIEKAISLDNSYAEAIAYRGWLYTMQRQHKKAVATAEHAYALNPNSAEVCEELGLTLMYAGRCEEAIKILEKGLRLSPMPTADYLLISGMAYFYCKRYKEGISLLKKSIFLEPDDYISHNFLAACYASVDRDYEAKAEVEEILRIRPKFSVAIQEKIAPIKDASQLKHFLDALRKAGLPETNHPPLPDKPSIAVLPFENMSNDPEQEYFSDGMTDELIGDLAKIKDIFVISRNSAFTYKGKSIKVQQIAKDLNVRYILEGSVQKSGNKVRIRAQLIDGKTDHHIWSESYDGVLDDIFELQDKITGKIVSALSVHLSIMEESNVLTKETTHMLAYDSFLKGNHHFNKRTSDDFIVAIEHFEQAIKIDPNYSRAYGMLGLTNYYGALLGFISFLEEFNLDGSKARLIAVNYLKLAMKNPSFEAYRLSTLIELFRRHFKEAIVLSEKAFSMKPNDAIGNRILGSRLVWVGRPEEGIEYLNKAIHLDPKNNNNLGASIKFIGLAHFSMGQFQKAKDFLIEGHKYNQKEITLSSVLAASHAYLGEDIEAKKQLEKFLSLWPSFFVPSIQELYYLFPFKNVEVFDRLAKGLVKAGLPRDPSDYYKIIEENKLTGKEIRETFYGHTLAGITMHGLELWKEYDKEGHFKLKILLPDSTGKINELNDIGTCWIEGDMLCNQYKWNDNLPSCIEYYKNPDGSADNKSEYLAIDETNIAKFSVVD